MYTTELTQDSLADYIAHNYYDQVKSLLAENDTLAHYSCVIDMIEFIDSQPEFAKSFFQSPAVCILILDDALLKAQNLISEDYMNHYDEDGTYSSFIIKSNCHVRMDCKRFDIR